MGIETPQTEVDYQAIVETVPAIVFVAETGPDGAWHYVNDWIEPILGFTVQEWVGVTARWSGSLHPEDRERVLEAEAAATGGAQHATTRTSDKAGSIYLDYRMLHKDGRVVWIRDSSALVRTPAGKLLWQGVMLDITDQKLVEDQLERQSGAQAAVVRLGGHALSGVPIDELLGEACRVIADVLGVEATAASRISEPHGALELRAMFGWPGEDLAALTQLDPQGAGIRALTSGRPVLVQDWAAETDLVQSAALQAASVRSSLVVRIEGPSTPWGLFGAFACTPEAFSEHDLNFVVAVTNILADAIERLDAEDAMAHRALHDLVTGLPNRSLFTDRLEQALERVRRHPGTLAAVLFIDVDHFKRVNDTLGHQAGDELLVGVATRLREAVRPTDTVARFGGDEFGLLLEEISTERIAIATAERIAAGFARPFALESGSQFITASIGIAIASGPQDARALLRDADAAMYSAKQRGRARYDIFDDELRARALARGRIENELRRAIETGELRLLYQPSVDLADERLEAVEALLRWEHPQRGLLAPAEFVQVAEESGLIERIGQWVIEEALRDATRWERMRNGHLPLRVAVNVSVAQLLNMRFPDHVQDAIQAADIEPSTLALELDESVLRDEAEQIRSALRLLKRVGVLLAVHDFGTGDSSLRQLAALPIDTIKVVRRFVAALGTEDTDGPIAHAVIRTGAALGLKVIGLGVESAEQARELRALGCHAAQGFLYSEPLAAAQIDELLAAGGEIRRTV